jgi:hypothetical protein
MGIDVGQQAAGEGLPVLHIESSRGLPGVLLANEVAITGCDEPTVLPHDTIPEQEGFRGWRIVYMLYMGIRKDRMVL